MAKYEGLPQDDRHSDEVKDTKLCEDQETLYTNQSRPRYGAGWKINIIFLFVLLTSLVQNGILYWETKLLAKQVTMGISRYCEQSPSTYFKLWY